MTHIALHFILPAVATGLFFRRDWKVAYLVMTSTMLVDLDHLLASPVYDSARCSIGFHPLHGLFPIALYAALCFVPKFKLHYIGIGLTIHMALDSFDCHLAHGVWFV